VYWNHIIGLLNNNLKMLCVSWPSPLPLTPGLQGQGLPPDVGWRFAENVTYTWLHMTQGPGRRLGLTRNQLERKADHIVLGKPKTEMPGGSLTGTNVPQEWKGGWVLGVSY